MGFEMLDVVAVHGAEQVAFAADDETGLRAIVAIHSTVLGPGLGGTRYYPFASEQDALVDVLRLAKGMAYKHAVCGNDLGGAKAVIIGDPRTARSDALIVEYAKLVDRLVGRYLTAEDVGTTQADMDLIRTITPHVTGVSESLGGSGDPSPATAWGVFHALKAVAERLWDDSSLEGRHVAIAGIGKVGSALARHLAAEGCRLTLADVRAVVAAALADALGARTVDPSNVHQVECDVLSPCALGATINEHTVPELRCAAVCGCANNQLATDEDGDRLATAGVLYAPDYVVNAGGVINIADELGPDGYNRERAWRQVATIHDTLSRVFAVAADEGITPAAAADRIAERRLGTKSSA
jgi:glutamate dehydrogenase/leucine dehydrogenase